MRDLHKILTENSTSSAFDFQKLLPKTIEEPVIIVCMYHLNANTVGQKAPK
jgi:hypothetical protein